MWVPDYTVKEVTFLIGHLDFWRKWAEDKIKEWGLKGTPHDNIQRLVEEANRFEGVGHSRKG